MENQLFLSLEKNKQKFDSFFNSAADYFFKYIKISNVRCAVVMCEDLTDAQRLWEVFLHPLNNLEEPKEPIDIWDYILNNTTLPTNPESVATFEKSMFFLTSSFAILLVDGVNKGIVLPVQGYPARGVDQPTNEGNL